MDGNRTHPGRLSSAPQTVLKTAGVTSADVPRRTPEIELPDQATADDHADPPQCTQLAVILAV